MTGYLYIFACIVFTVYGQMILKWRIKDYGALPAATLDKVTHLFGLLLDPWIISGFASAFIASLFWMAAMTKFELSFAYPFMSLSFVFVLVISTLLLGEMLTLGKVIGLALIIAGLIVSVNF